MIGSISSDKFMSRVDCTKSFIKKGIIRRWKSSKELFMPSHSRHTSTTNDKCQSKLTDDKRNYDNIISLYENNENKRPLANLDEFERNFLLSAGKKVLVKELRKNFETSAQTATNDLPNGRPNIRSEAKDLPKSEKSKILANELQTLIESKDGNRSSSRRLLLSCHSFYNTYRNEYLASNNDLYSSNRSLNICCNSNSENSPSNKTLTKTFSKYNEFIKSSSTIDLSKISSSSSSSLSASTSNLQNYAVNYVKLNGNGNDGINHIKNSLSVTDVRANMTPTSSSASSPSSATTVKRNVCNIKRVYSVNNLSTTERTVRTRTNPNEYYPNDTQSLIFTSSSIGNIHNGSSATDCVHEMDYYYSSVNNNDDRYRNRSRMTCANTNHLHKLAMEKGDTEEKHSRVIILNNNDHDNGENNNNNNNHSTSTSYLNGAKLRKCSSTNQIYLDVLKHELNQFIDSSTNFGSGNLTPQRKRFKKELDLEQKIDLEIKMREGSAKLLAACNNTKSIGFIGNATSAHNTQILEAAKNLLTSNERMTAYMAELQRRKRDRVADTTSNASDTADNQQQTGRGKVSLSELRMPLIWRDTDHFKNKGDHRRFAVFCLIKIGTDIYDTSLLCPVDRSSTDVTFNDAILFTNVEPNFELKLEVYAVMMESDLTIASTPRKIKNTIHSSISRTVGKRLAASLKDELNNTKIGPKFELIATSCLMLSDASDLPHTHDLSLITPTSSVLSNTNTSNANNRLPLFGHFCCRLAVQPDFMCTSYYSGVLRLLPKGNILPLDGFGRLQAFKIQLWDSIESSENNMEPCRHIEINRDTKLKLKNDATFVVCNMEEGAMIEYYFRTQSSHELTKWQVAIKRAIKEHMQWDHITLSTPMKLSVPGNMNKFFGRSPRQGTLYDQLDTIEPRESTRPATIHDMFKHPGDLSNATKLDEYRSRTNSTSSTSLKATASLTSGILSSSTTATSTANSSSSRRSHWPFGK